MSVEEVWRRGRQWSVLASTLSRALARWRKANIALVLMGAVLGALATAKWFGPTTTSVLGVAGAVALSVAAFVQSRFLGAERVQERVNARAAAESVKAAVNRYLAGVAPV